MKSHISIIAFAFMLLATLNVSAQRGGGRNDDGPRFGWDGEAKGNGIPTRFAFISGGNYSNISPASGSALTGKDGWKPGFRGGMMMAVAVNAKFSIHTEAVYALLNSESKTAAFDMRLSFLELPLLASFDLSQDLHLVAGPQFNFLMSAKITDHTVKTNLYQSLSNSNTSVAAGIDYLPKKFGVSLRYQHGLNSIDRNSGLYPGYIRSLSLGAIIKL